MLNPLLKKLQIKAGFHISIEHAPEQAAAIFGEVPADVFFHYNGRETFDALITFSRNQKQLDDQIKRNLNQINAKTIFWIFYPKKSSKIESDLDLMKNWKNLQIYNLSPCAFAAVNETWTGLRIKLASEVKASGLGNGQIKENGYGDFIDPDQKKVTCPPDLQKVLSSEPKVRAFFDGLSYSNKKEYVLWILSANKRKRELTELKRH